MVFLFNNNSVNYNIVKISYSKLKINFFFLNFKIIVYIINPIKDIYSLKNKFLSYNIFSLYLRKKYIKALFNYLNFSFLDNNNYLCVFINDNKDFLRIIQILGNKQQFYYSYKYSFSNLVLSTLISEEYNKYNNNYIYIQFILKKIKVKIIILLFFFSISIIRYIK